MKANETIGTFAYDGLIIDGKHSLDVKSISITVEIMMFTAMSRSRRTKPSHAAH